MKILVLLFSLTVFAVSANECKFELPKSYLAKSEKNFCLEFVPSYLEKIQNLNEDTTYTGTKAESTVNIQFNNRTMILFLLSQTAIESGWANGISRRYNNYWGIGGWYPKADGSNTFKFFNSFDESFSYLLNHLTHGINISGVDNKYHPGWPMFVDLIKSEREDITGPELNKALNSGPYCRKYPAYNTDRQRSCRNSGSKDCPCVDYGGKILGSGIKTLLKKCMKTYLDFYSDLNNMENPNDAMDPEASDIDKSIRIWKAYTFFYEESVKRFPETFCKK